MTFEANLGLGWQHLSYAGESDTSNLGIGGLCLGVGGWMNERLALTARLAGVTVSPESVDGNYRVNAFFLGGALQYWIDNHFWVGGGAGLAIASVSGYGEGDSRGGFGLDARVGYTFSQGTENTFNVSFELTPGFYMNDDENSGESGPSLTGIAILLGYQHL